MSASGDIGVSGRIGLTAFAVVGAVVLGCMAYSHLALLAPPRNEQGTWCTYTPIDGRLHGQGR